MEKVTAYRAFNGRLFDTEEKCLAYERKQAEYPKSQLTIIPQADGVAKYVTSTWEKPSSQRQDESHFLVGGKIRVYTGKNVKDLDSTYIMGYCWQPLDKIVCSVILNGGMEFNDKLAAEVCEIYNACVEQHMKKSQYKYSENMVAEVTDTDHETYWVIEDKAWRGCAISHVGRIVRIEK